MTDREDAPRADTSSMIGACVQYPVDFGDFRVGKVVKEDLDRDLVWIEEEDTESPEKQMWFGKLSQVELLSDDE